MSVISLFGAENVRKHTALALFGPKNMTYLLLAAIIGAGGLITDSRSLVVGAMLISPFFVPVINMNLKSIPKQAVRNNVLILAVSAAVCILIGYVSAKVLKLNENPETQSMKDIVNWNRTSKQATIMAWLVPIVAGVIVAIANKSQNIIPMVGVAIAISILPPLVNAGLYLGKGPSHKDQMMQSLKFGLMNIVLAAASYTATTKLVLK